MPRSLEAPFRVAATHHFIERSAQRRLEPTVLQFILTFGTAVRASGATHLTVIERDLPAHLRGSAQASRARGWIVLQADGGALLTCYRRRDALRFLRRKPKRRLSRTQLRRARASLLQDVPAAIRDEWELGGGEHAR